MTLNIKNYLGNLTLTVLLSIWFWLFFIPKAIAHWHDKLDIFIKAIENASLHQPIIFLSITIILLTAYFNNFGNIVRRWKNNLKLKQTPFTLLDFIFWFTSIGAIIYLITPPANGNQDHIKFYSHVVYFLLFPHFAGMTCYSLHLLFPKDKKQNASTNAMDANSNITPHDEPIRYPTEDKFGRTEFVDSLYNQITKFPYDEPFVFGLYGEWGSGKTSVLNLLECKLCDPKLSGSQKTIYFKYDPWNMSSNEAIIKNFYENFIATYNKDYYLMGLGRLLHNYGKSLIKGIDISWVKLNFFSEADTLEALKNEIQACIDNIDKKTVIIVDNIDRLDNADDIRTIFRIVKETGRFDKVIYVLAFDVNAVKKLLKEDSDGENSFIEKIVQAPQWLPQIEENIINDFIYNEIEELLKHHGITTESKTTGQPIIDYEKIRGFSTTLRDAKRYINSLKAHLPPIINEVNVDDFLMLEILKVFYSGLYNDIQNNSEFYLGSVRPLWDVTETSKEQKYKKNTEHIDLILEKTKNKKKKLLELLGELFFSVIPHCYPGTGWEQDINENHRATRRLAHPDIFQTYFMLRILKTELSAQEIEQLLTLLKETDEKDAVIVKYLEKCREEEKLPSLYQALSEIEEDVDLDTCTALIRIYCEHSASYEIENIITKYSRQHINTTYFNVLEKLIKYHYQNDTTKEIELTISNCIASTPTYHIAIDLAQIIPNNSTFNQKISERFSKDFLSNKANIFEVEKFTKVLYQWSLLCPQDKPKINTYTLELLDQNPAHVEKLLLNFFKPNDNRFDIEHYNDLKSILNIDSFVILIKEYRTTFNINADCKNIIDRLLEIHTALQSSPLTQRQIKATEIDFSNIRSEAFRDFDIGNYMASLEKYEQILKQYHAIPKKNQKNFKHFHDEARRRLWEVLIRLACNNGQRFAEEYYEQSKEIVDSFYKILELYNLRDETEAIENSSPFVIHYYMWNYCKLQILKANRSSEFHNFEETFNTYHKFINNRSHHSPIGDRDIATANRLKQIIETL